MQILLCQCKSAHLIPDAVYQSVLSKLADTGAQIVCVDDLCAMAASKDERLKQWTQQPLTVMACYERAVRSLFDYAGAPLPSSASVLNLRTARSAGEVLDRLQTAPGTANITQIQAAALAWPAWYPVIDRTRCKECKQCLNFCLFGVYGQAQDKTVRVVRPQSCKNGCPACARVCPHAAIIFPKYDKTPINGDLVDESQWQKSHAESAQSLKHRLGGSVYQLLRQRRPDSPTDDMQQLRELKDKLDIPDHLFNQNAPDSDPKGRS
jgi:Pyruvate/2-oxoacid:ferredoxin oxidoreductase delta subunit